MFTDVSMHSTKYSNNALNWCYANNDNKKNTETSVLQQNNNNKNKAATNLL